MGCGGSNARYIAPEPTPPDPKLFARRRLSIGGGYPDGTEEEAAPPPAEGGDVDRRAVMGLGKRRQSFQSPELDQSLNPSARCVVVNPFPDSLVGTFTNHGVKPIFGTAGPGEVKTNQDRGLVTYPVGENPRQALLCVFDGHGKAGEEVSEFVMLRFPDLLEADKDRLSDPEQREKCLEENVLLVDRVLKESQCPSATNGTTACIMLVQELAGQALTVTLANVGDSRAVKGTLAVDASTGAERWATSDLTSDHKPDLPEERKRVEQSGGRVSEASELDGPARIWFNANGPGLAMSRSIGDHACRRFGVVATPDVTCFELTEDDKVLILATDGVWEVLSSQEAVEVVAKHSDATEASRASLVASHATPHSTTHSASLPPHRRAAS